jgi:hypothetical protein
MQAAPIVVPLDEFLDPLGQVLHITVVVGVDFFTLQSLENFRKRCHADAPADSCRHYLVFLKHLDVGFAGILHTTIRVVNESRRRLPTQNRLSQGAEGKSLEPVEVRCHNCSSAPQLEYGISGDIAHAIFFPLCSSFLAKCAF